MSWKAFSEKKQQQKQLKQKIKQIGHTAQP